MKRTYEFENLGCAHCAGKMEEKIGKLPEVESVNLSFPMKKMYVETSSEDLLPVIQKICTDIEPDVIVTEVLKKSSKKRKDEEVHEEHCGCGCESQHEGHEHHHHQHHHDHEHHHHHDKDHCDCGCCDDDDDDEGTIAAATKRQGNGKATVFIVEKLGCAHCAGKMEEQISHLPGVEAVNLTFATKQLRVWSDDAKALLPQIQEICTSIEPDVKVVIREDTVRAQKEAKKAKNNSEDNREYLELGIGIVLFIAGKIFESSKPVYSTACFLLAYLILGIKIVWTALRNISKGQVFDENFLMSIATIGAFGIGEYAEAVGVMLFYRIGELFEEKAVERSRSQIMDVIDMRPEVVNLVNEHGDVSVIDAEEAEIGDILLVRPGDRIPLDGVITDGETMIDTSPVTGEPVPISGFEGTEVTSGCLNTSGVIKIRVEKVLEESMVTRIMDSVENAAASKPKMDRFITRFSRVYTPFVVFMALATAIIPSIITGNWTHWVYTALTFLVISCPCALVLSVPLAFFSGIGAGSKIGILFKGGAALETLKDITSVVMDKTGTITKGNFKVQDVVTFGDVTRNELLSLAASCEESSTHPIAKSIMEAAKEENISYKTAESAKEIAGHGSVIKLDGSEVLAGNKKLMNQYHIAGEYKETTSYGTEVFLAKDGVLIGAVVIADTLKDDAKSAIASLKAQKLHTVMLTGDSESAANAIAEETGIDEVYSKLLPDEKLLKLQEQRTKHGAVMFVGDGINDAPVLAGADCGVAMGSGADAAIEAADVVFMTSSVEAIPQAIAIGKKASRIAWQNVVFALVVKALVMILGLLGFANMWMAVFADTGVAMLCVLNSIRALKIQS
ncbi:MAG: heavy metal translocating P-type ATPase [Anaerostipes sp.]|jgi:Cd2+/Zn2+-exporting ATPase|uniref:Cd(2+)-exporting ATPase n=1 Tax=Anaerostipes amylophilus TaxID=2981779 RepID=A0ABV1ITN5_9FIRM|nr:heavy metal translocating P-type ATPase [Anaerostipes amylophilus]MBS5414933.1 cadmium-translocating P-type ATPase [Bacillota bacterium]MCU6780291.1 heavy metal translocating P-type ATPase [Anaerostipes amylophilus]CUN41564.1 Cadmium%2C zinc and cobalt-transporting ATPase [Anaerostipes hadrus]